MKATLMFNNNKFVVDVIKWEVVKKIDKKLSDYGNLSQERKDILTLTGIIVPDEGN